MLIPTEWYELMDAVRAVCPDVVMAGGALRDLDNGRPVKDIDLFIHGPNSQTVEGLIARLNGAGLEVSYDDTCEVKAYPQDQNLEVVQIASMEWDDLDVQIIFCNWEMGKIVDRFDYGICKISFDGKEVFRHAEYIEDKGQQVFRLRRERTDISMRGSILRYARLLDKYPGWDWQPYMPQHDFWAPFNCA